MALCDKSPVVGGGLPTTGQTNVQSVLCPLHFSAIRRTYLHDLR